MGIITTLLAPVIPFVVGLLVGGLAVYVGAQLVVGKGDFRTAVWTALFGSLGWALVSLLFGWVPLLGPLIGTVLGLAVYLGIVAVQYNVDWTEAAAISFVAWISVVVARLVLGPLLGPGIVGVPFV